MTKLELWLIYSFFIHPLILPTSEIWVGYTLSCSNRAAKVHQTLMNYRLKIGLLKRTFGQQSCSNLAANVTHLYFKVGRPTRETHFLKVGQSCVLEVTLASCLQWVHPVFKCRQRGGSTHF